MLAKKSNFRYLLKHIFSVFQNLSTFLFYLSDHRVLLSELKVIDASYKEAHYAKSYKFYMFENICGVLRNLMEILEIFSDGKYEEQSLDMKTMNILIKRKFFDLVRCLLDILVALHYLNKTISAKKAGIIGVITSIMSIAQILALF